MKSLCLLGEELLVFDVYIPSMRRTFVICSWKSIWHLLRRMEMIRNVDVLQYVWVICKDTLWENGFVRCIRNVHVYFERDVICKMYEKYV